MSAITLAIPPDCSSLDLPRYIPMSNNDSQSPSFISRLFQNDAARKGVAGAVAGILVAVVAEALWPSA